MGLQVLRIRGDKATIIYGEWDENYKDYSLKVKMWLEGNKWTTALINRYRNFDCLYKAAGELAKAHGMFD